MLHTTRNDDNIQCNPDGSWTTAVTYRLAAGDTSIDVPPGTILPHEMVAALLDAVRRLIDDHCPSEPEERLRTAADRFYPPCEARRSVAVDLAALETDARDL